MPLARTRRGTHASLMTTEVKRWVFLSGPSGAGKSTIAPLVAKQLKMPALDLDVIIAERSGLSIAELFRRDGEEAFRRLEAAVLKEVLASSPPSVVALGGGTVKRASVRQRLRRHGTIITLCASAKKLAERVSRDLDAAGHSVRPLLSGNAEAQLAELMTERQAAYAECHATINSSGALSHVAQEVVTRIKGDPLAVFLGSRSYSIRIVHGDALRVLQQEHSDLTTKPLFIADANTKRYAPKDALVLPPGESSKHMDSIAQIWKHAITSGADRKSMLVGVGGGVIGDMTGFAAATLFRGIDFSLMPTSLLSMVDASVGGKTGVNLEVDGSVNKNLVGAFVQPRAVVCDLSSLQTLPDREFRSGLGEVVKAAWLAGDDAVAQLECDADALVARDLEATERTIRMAIELKIRVVERDEREQGVRALLNLGHTFGHAFEARSMETVDPLTHGEAVALGMTMSARLSEKRGLISGAARERLEKLLKHLSLPTELAPQLHGLPETLELLKRDKKKDGDAVRFVWPTSPGDGGACIEKIGFDALESLASQV